MLRRSLPVAATAAAAFVLVPGAASAAPDQPPPENTFWADYGVYGQVALPDGRQAQFALGEHRGASKDGWTASLSLTTWTDRDCGWWQCQDDMMSGHVELDADDVHFSRNLTEAWVADVPVTLQSWTWSWPEGATLAGEEEVLVSVHFTGSGPVSRSVHHGDMCSDGQTACQAMHLQSTREAVGSVTVGDQVASTSASIQYMQIAETAPKSVEGDGQPLPPDGEYPPPPSGDGEYYVPPPTDGSFN